MNEAVVEQVTTEVSPEKAEQEAAAALEAGYKKARGETPAEVEKIEQKEIEPEKVEAEPKAEIEKTQPDPWEGVNPALKAMLEGISTKVGEVDKLGQRFKSFEGRLGHVQNAIAAADAAAKATGTAAPTQTQVTTAAQSSAKWKQLKDDFPEWGDAIEERMAAQAAELSKNAPTVDVAKIKNELEAGFTQSVKDISEASTQRARQLAQLDIKYPTWETDVYVTPGVHTPVFAEWLKVQAPEVQALTTSESAADAVKVLDTYYADQRIAAEKAEKDEKKKARLAAAVTPKQATSGGPTVLPDEAGLEVGYKRAKRLT